MSQTEPLKRLRLPVIDIVRGVAIIAMVFYHLSWDLWSLRFVDWPVAEDMGWLTFQRSILSTFMFLVGVGLVLGHGDGIRWQRFWRRWLFVVAGALIVTGGTLVSGLSVSMPAGGAWPLVSYTPPAAYIYFGVLHAIAASMLLALSFVLAPIWLTGLVAAVVIGLPFFYADPFFNEIATSWIGFWTVPPLTNDLVPLFPWFGVTLLGVAATRLLRGSAFESRLAAIHPRNILARVLGWMGRWSLLIYLVHQPLLLAILVPLSMALGTAEAGREVQFLQSCQSSCEATGTTAAQCTVYCQCGLEGVERDDLWDPVFTGIISSEQQAQLDANNRQCSALIYPELGTE